METGTKEATVERVYAELQDEAIQAIKLTARNAIIGIFDSKDDDMLRYQWEGFRNEVNCKKILEPAMSQLTEDQFDGYLWLVSDVCESLNNHRELDEHDQRIYRSIRERNFAYVAGQLTDEIESNNEGSQWKTADAIKWMRDTARSLTSISQNDPTLLEVVVLDLSLILNIVTTCNLEIVRLKSQV